MWTALPGATVSSTALKQAVSQAIAEASGKEQAAAHFVPGAYTTTAQGNNGAVTVETTFSEDKIEKIEVVNHHESQGVCEKALFTELPQAILDEQSLAVDTIAGATVASNALISAVRQAAEQAGCDVSALMNAPEKKAPETTEYTADVIIVGAAARVCPQPWRRRTRARASSSLKKKAMSAATRWFPAASSTARTRTCRRKSK